MPASPAAERARATLRSARSTARRATSAARALPDFLLIGAQKAGTTSLYAYLAAHPDVRPAARKEVHYFDLGFAAGAELGEGGYRAMFPLRAGLALQRRRAAGPVLTGEASPYYLFHPVAPERAAALVPRARLLVLVRDPVERAWSHYRHEVAAGREPLEFAAALDAEPGRLDGADDDLRRGIDSPAARHHRRHAYVGRGRYADQLCAWLAFYPREQVHVMVAEELFAKPEPVWRSAVEFLGLTAVGPPPFAVHNPGTGEAEQVMDPACRARLRETFAGPDAELADLLGRPLPW
jgi:Sulfotransferase domain